MKKVILLRHGESELGTKDNCFTANRLDLTGEKAWKRWERRAN